MLALEHSAHYTRSMREFQGGKPFRRHLRSFPILILLIIATFFLSVSVWGLYEKNHYAQVNLAEVRARVQALEVRKARLSATVVRLATPEGEEVEIRSRFPVALPGEQVLSMVDATSAPATSTQVAQDEAPWWQFWR